ncbi:MAG: GtrA family protein [Bacteroidetes bacterium]|jgi:putative flippase GtrA|nr:GtrA family protein [Bacteroidota bacterium]MBT4340263.1 GtrA family protein [Bacteroidota bacterium]MBT4728869.1 GtrA family protein [Bacteroidota bacterium]MBT6686239.1 GtrA family protein [Bacteroidota bacterium]MBT7994007.1 GtrA family protein [Bacteroidota bacterium]
MKSLDKIVIFSKAQVSAFIGGIVDYLVMILFTEVFHLHYTISIVIGGVIGAIVNFSLNKGWTFYSEENPYKHSVKIQLLKFVLVVFNSILIKDIGTYLITTYLIIDYKISKLFVDLLVSVVFNYSLQKYWVFKKIAIIKSKDQ